MAAVGHPRYGGRKKGVQNKKDSLLSQQIEKIISTEERIKILATAARGYWVKKEVGKEKSAVVYMTAPDTDAVKQLNEMQHGKPRQMVVHATVEDAPIGIVYLPKPKDEKVKKR